MINPTIEYHIDANDRIVFVSDNWDTFATDNDADLPAAAVLNRPLFEFISDRKCEYLYQVIFAEIRKNRSTLKFPFRCDAPETRRFMNMTVTAHNDDSIELVSTIVREEKRKPLPLITAIDEKERLLIMCSWCKKVQVIDKNWIEFEEALTRLHIFESDNVPAISHGMCQACYDNTINALRSKGALQSKNRS